MARLTLFLLLLVVLVILVLSNLSPIALTFLGIRTLELPLGVWIVGALGAGALTTLILSLLYNWSHPSAGRRPSRANPRRVAPSASRPWTAWTNREPQPVGQSSRTAASIHDRLDNDDWESSRPSREEWDDWSSDEQEPPRAQPPFSPPQNASSSPPNPSFYRPQTEVQDREDEAWGNWEGYTDEQDDREEFEDHRGTAFGNLNDRPSRPAPPPQRTEFESPQAPETRRQEGSVYSYGYRRPSEQSPTRSADWTENTENTERDLDDRPYDALEDDSFQRSSPDDRQPPRRPAARSEEVYDADYRVIVPPYRPEPETAFNPSDAAAFDSSEVYPDGFPLEPGGEPPSIEALYGLDDEDEDEDETEIWDEDWGLEDEPKSGDRPG